jgi:hypothetical protein
MVFQFEDGEAGALTRIPMENFKWDEIHTILITFATNFRTNCAQTPGDDAPESRR